jgi:hypothetical protein
MPLSDYAKVRQRLTRASVALVRLAGIVVPKLCSARGTDFKRSASRFVIRWFRKFCVAADRAVVSHKTRSIDDENRWDEKTGLRRDAVRSQVIDAL